MTRKGDLIDVTGGDSSGTASSTYKDGKYMLYVTFENLPEPQEGEFYLGAKKEEDFQSLLKKDPKLKDLFEGKWEKYGLGNYPLSPRWKNTY